MNSYKILDGSLSCSITVPGDGKGRYGKPKNDRTGPLSSFLVNNQVFFTVVKNHLKTCSKCSIDAVLTVYRDRTISKLTGCSSNSLIRHALGLEKIAIENGETLTPGLVNEILWRGGPQPIREFRTRLSVKEKLMAFSHPRYKSMDPYGFGLDGLSFDNLEIQLINLASQEIGLNLNDQEILELCEISEVMCT